MDDRPTEKRVAFLVVIFFCLVMGTSVLTIINYLKNSEIETAVRYQGQRLKTIETETQKIQKTTQGTTKKQFLSPAASTTATKTTTAAATRKSATPWRRSHRGGQRIRKTRHSTSKSHCVKRSST